MTIGERIKAAREAKGLTLEEVGRLCNTTKQSIYKYESGVVTNIPIERIEQLSTVLGTTPGQLTGWATPEQEQKEDRKAEIEKLLEGASDDKLREIVRYIKFTLNEDQ